MNWVNNSCYKGEWKNGTMDGDGELFIPGEKERVGLFKENKFIGHDPNRQRENAKMGKSSSHNQYDDRMLSSKLN